MRAEANWHHSGYAPTVHDARTSLSPWVAIAPLLGLATTLVACGAPTAAVRPAAASPAAASPEAPKDASNEASAGFAPPPSPGPSASAQAAAPPPPPPAPDGTLLDAQTGTMWTRVLTQPLAWSPARTYCDGVKLAGFKDWRLPTKAELEAIIDRSRIDDDPGAAGAPLREPFRTALPAEGYVFSGELIKEPDQPWIMNLRNAHLFNGQGYQGYVVCTRRRGP